VTIDGVWTDNRVYWKLTTPRTSKDYAVTVLHTSQITIGHTRSSQSVTVFISRFLVAASNEERSASSRFPNCSCPQTPTSHRNISQELNPSDYLTATPNLSCLSSARTSWKHLSSVAVYWPLPSNDRCIVTHFAIVAQQESRSHIC
jgi:hypothetical protein